MHFSDRHLRGHASSVLERIREALRYDDWDTVRRLWPRVPEVVRSSARGHAIWARVHAGADEHTEAGKCYYQAYVVGRDPQFLLEATLAFLRGHSWELAGLALDSICGVPDTSHLPGVIRAVAEEINFEQIYAERVKKTEDSGRIPAAWFQDETLDLRKYIFRLVCEIVLTEPNPSNVTSLMFASRAFNFEHEALEVLRGIDIEQACRWSCIADLASILGDQEGAREAYERFVTVESQLPEIVPDQTCDGLPIVMLHRGGADFMRHTLESLRGFHPHKRIIVIGDDYNRMGPELQIEYRQWNHYTSDALFLRRSYEHLSINPYPFELLCLERWFVLHEFCKKEAVHELIHLDSDVLCFDSLDDLEPEMRRHDAMTCGVQAGVGYFKVQALSRLCDTIQEFYADFKSLPELRGRNVNDMLFCGYVAETDGWGNFLSLDVDGIIDNHIRTSDGYEMKDGVKAFEFHNGHPYAIRESDRRKVRFRTVHFQGPSKCLIRVFAERAAESRRVEPIRKG